MNDLRQALKSASAIAQETVAGCDEFDAFAQVFDAARRVLGFPSPEAVEAAARAIHKIHNVGSSGAVVLARAALVAAATTDFGKDADGD